MNNVTKENLEAMAVDFGLPVQWLNFVGGWLLGCQACATAGEVVKLYAQGKITRAEHKDLFIKVANAKSQDDLKALKELKGQLEVLRPGQRQLFK
jgi:hypothetical protein